MSYATFEYTLAKLLTDAEFLDRFLSNPTSTIDDLDLTQSEKLALFEMDQGELSLAATSFQKKRTNCKSQENLDLIPAIYKTAARFTKYLHQLIRRLN